MFPVERGRNTIRGVHLLSDERNRSRRRRPKDEKNSSISPMTCTRKVDILRSIKINYLKYGDLTEKTNCYVQRPGKTIKEVMPVQKDLL